MLNNIGFLGGAANPSSQQSNLGASDFNAILGLLQQLGVLGGGGNAGQGVGVNPGLGGFGAGGPGGLGGLGGGLGAGGAGAVAAHPYNPLNSLRSRNVALGRPLGGFAQPLSGGLLGGMNAGWQQPFGGGWNAWSQPFGGWNAWSQPFNGPGWGGGGWGGGWSSLDDWGDDFGFD